MASSSFFFETRTLNQFDLLPYRILLFCFGIFLDMCTEFDRSIFRFPKFSPGYLIVDSNEEIHPSHPSHGSMYLATIHEKNMRKVAAAALPDGEYHGRWEMNGRSLLWLLFHPHHLKSYNLWQSLL
jgi:hypothetical protein